jgi:hypothetical protein
MTKLWTFHPPEFDLCHGERVDHTRGRYWNSTRTVQGVCLKERYRLVLPMLHQRLGTDQVLWCDTVNDARWHFDEIDEIGWELDVPGAQVAAFFWVMAWEDILWGKTQNWEDLFVEEVDIQPSHEIGAIVRFPLERQWIRCLGKPAPFSPPSEKLTEFPLWEKKKNKGRA